MITGKLSQGTYSLLSRTLIRGSHLNTGQPGQVTRQRLIAAWHAVAVKNMGEKGGCLLCAEAAGLVHRHGICDTQIQCGCRRAGPHRVESRSGEFLNAVASGAVLAKQRRAAVRLCCRKDAVSRGLRWLLSAMRQAGRNG
jgi:hypothetical protein